MWTITCGSCRHEADAEMFLTNQHNRYCCPACGTVWRIEHQGAAKMTESGFVIPPQKMIIVEPQLMLTGV